MKVVYFSAITESDSPHESCLFSAITESDSHHGKLSV